MCFSATASFGAGVALTALGVVAIKKTQERNHLLFASIPLLFAAQQLTEGCVWLSLTNPAYVFMQQASTHVFIFFAQVVWPVWVPLSIYYLVPRHRRNFSSRFLIAIGVMVGLNLAYCLSAYYIEAHVEGYHIYYQQDYPSRLGGLFSVLYFIATVFPPFFTRIRRMWYFGIAVVISYVITEVFYTQYIISVWCFFAAIISASILAVVYGMERHPESNA